MQDGVQPSAKSWPEYKDLYFGKSDSAAESSADPDGFVKSYVDLHGAANQVLRGEKFLVLGPKGTGKSALAWYLDASQAGADHLALVRDASSLPLAEIPRLKTGQPQGPERTVVAWKFVLLCSYLELLLSDQACSLQKDPEVLRVAELLRDFGFMGDASGRALTKASGTTVTIPIPKLGTIYKRESKPHLNIYNLIPYMENWASAAGSKNRHVLLVDGLDSIFLNDRKYDESTSSLVQATYNLNQKLRKESATGSIALLFRNDVFSRIALTLPDSQKMRDDQAIELDWRVLTGPMGRKAPLLELVNTKVSQAAGVADIDVLDYFPPHVSVGRNRKDQSPLQIDTFQYLLNLTRHTPRDLLRLFEEIRKTDETGVYHRDSGVLSMDTIREGIVQYATKYFVGAINNEFAGFEGGVDAALAATTALKNMGRQRFDAAEFKAAISQIDERQAEKSDRLLELLFYAGAIGNHIGKPHEAYMQFYHRRDDVQIYLRGRFVVHNALVHAWNLRRTGNPGKRGGRRGEGTKNSPLRSKGQSSQEKAKATGNSQQRQRRRRRSRGGRPVDNKDS